MAAKPPTVTARRDAGRRILIDKYPISNIQYSIVNIQLLKKSPKGIY